MKNTNLVLMIVLAIGHGVLFFTLQSASSLDKSSGLIGIYRHPVSLIASEKVNIFGGALRRPELAWIGKPTRIYIKTKIAKHTKHGIEYQYGFRQVFEQQFDIEKTYQTFSTLYNKEKRPAIIEKTTSPSGEAAYKLLLAEAVYIPTFNVSNKQALESYLSIWGPEHKGVTVMTQEVTMPKSKKPIERTMIAFDL